LNLIVFLIDLEQVQFLLGVIEVFTKGTILAKEIEKFTAEMNFHVFLPRVKNFGCADP
jgi:hypothetical protein